jgi:hypothetical protein
MITHLVGVACGHCRCYHIALSGHFRGTWIEVRVLLRQGRCSTACWGGLGRSVGDGMAGSRWSMILREFCSIIHFHHNHRWTSTMHDPMIHYICYRYPRPVPFANSFTVLLSSRYCKGLERGTTGNALALLPASRGSKACEEI